MRAPRRVSKRYSGLISRRNHHPLLLHIQRRVRDVVKCPIFDAEFTTVLPVSRILLATEEENRHLSPSAFNNESGDGRRGLGSSGGGGDDGDGSECGVVAARPSGRTVLCTKGGELPKEADSAYAFYVGDGSRGRGRGRRR